MKDLMKDVMQVQIIQHYFSFSFYSSWFFQILQVFFFFFFFVNAVMVTFEERFLNLN